MNSSSSIVEISKALLQAQSKMGAATKGASNPYYKSRYADLNSVIEACKEHLNSAGIAVLQPVMSDETGDYIVTTLVHTSGEFLTSRMKIKSSKENDSQAFGSAISYSRRYSLQSMLFIPAEDDDAESTMVRQKPSKSPSVALQPVSTEEELSKASKSLGVEVKNTGTMDSNLVVSGTGSNTKVVGFSTPTNKPTFRKSKPAASVSEDI